MGFTKSDEKVSVKTDVDTSSDTTEEAVVAPEVVETDELQPGQCVDCKGAGIRNPSIDTRVCQTCEGTGKA